MKLLPAPKPLALLPAPPSFTHVRVINPFDPKQRTVGVETLQQGTTLANLYPIGLAHEFVVAINGKIVPDDQRALHIVEAGDYVISSPIPEGGGGGGAKTVLRLVAMIAVAVVAPELAAFAYGALVPGAFALANAGIYLAAITAGISIAGSMLVNALLPVKPANDSNPTDNGAESPSYGVDGAKNTGAEGMPVPVCYGNFRMAGNLIGFYVENVDNSQVVYMLFNAGEGVVADLTDLELNEQPIANFQDVEFQTRLGTPADDLIPWFADEVIPENIGAVLAPDVWNTHSTLGPADKLRIDVVCPGGLFEADSSSGALKERTVELAAEYREVGDTEWSPFPHVGNITGSTTSTVPVTVDSTAPSDDQANNTEEPLSTTVAKSTVDATYGTALTVTAKLRNPVRVSFMSPPLSTAVYEVRVKRVTPAADSQYVSDQITLVDINRVLLSDVAFNNTAKVAVKIKLGDQLSGPPNVTYINHGRVVRVWDAATRTWKLEPSNNPAWITLDAMTNRRYGGGIVDTRVDLERWKDWAAYCDANNLTFNGVIDVQTNLWDALQYVFRCGRAQIYSIGTRWSVVIERETHPSMLFTVGNMIENTYKETWLPQGDRANEVEVSYYDATDRNKQHTVKIFDSAAIAAQSTQKTAQLDLKGIVDAQRAWEEGALQLLLNRYVLKTAEWEAPLEAIGCTVGDVVYVQHDMPNYGQAGRMAQGSTTTVMQLDRPVHMEAGKTYSFLALYDAIERCTGTVASSSNGHVVLNGFVAPQETDRLRLFANGVDYEVTSWGAGYVQIADSVAIGAGTTYHLFAGDVIVEKTVSLNAGDHTSVTLTSPLPFPPAYLANWMFGESTKVKQTFRIKSVEGGNSEYTRHIVALQYDPRCYDIAAAPDLSSSHGVPPSRAALTHVRNLVASEQTFIDGTHVRTEVTISWDLPDAGVYKGADVSIGLNDAQLTQVASVTGKRSYTITAGKDTVVHARVVGFDINDARAQPPSAAPTLTYKVKGTIPNTNVPGVTGLELIWSGRDCKISWRYNSLTASYEFGNEPNGADQGALDPSFLDYEIRVYDGTSGKLLRTEHVTANSYTYLYDFNASDHGSDGPQRLLKFEIAYRDKFGKLGKPGKITAFNPPPTIETATLSAQAGFAFVSINFAKPSDVDFAGVVLYNARTERDLDATTLVYDGPNTQITLTNLFADANYHYQIGAYDAFGKVGMVLQGPFSYKTGVLDITAIADGIVGVDALDPLLRERIDLIDGPIGMANSVAARIQAEIDARVNALLGEQNARAAAIESLAMTTVSANFALTNQISVQASRIDGNTSAILNEQTTRAQGDSAIANSVFALSARTQTDNATLQAMIAQEQTARTTNDQALATQISQISASFNGVQTYFQPSAPGGAIAAGSIWYDSDDNNKPYRYNGTSWDLVADITSIGNSAAISAINDVSASSTSAIARQTSSILSAVSGHTATIQQQATAIDGLKAQYSVKIQIDNGTGKPYIAGFGLAAEPVNGVPVSEFAVLADKFSIALPGKPDVHPFTVGVAQNPVTGVWEPAVVISNLIVSNAAVNAANIIDGTITTGKIGDLQVDTLKIAGQAVSVPTAASSGTDFIPDGGFVNVIRGLPYPLGNTSGDNKVIITALGQVQIQGSSAQVDFLVSRAGRVICGGSYQVHPPTNIGFDNDGTAYAQYTNDPVRITIGGVGYDDAGFNGASYDMAVSVSSIQASGVRYTGSNKVFSAYAINCGMTIMGVKR
jgi:predicted phage tail protein